MTKDQIPADDILQIVTAPDDATIVAVHKRRAAFADEADKHATTRHNTARVDSPGEQS